jgi:hypothetical protein
VVDHKNAYLIVNINPYYLIQYLTTKYTKDITKELKGLYSDSFVFLSAFPCLPALLRRPRAAKALAEVQASRSAFGKPLAAEVK